ncbi:hypothetical protein CONCODRAFT_6176 [Conidiobolus coronatus NRRL 28638]|uniref:Uncharacterized protein n=1 Tax=Conidiobolus coronatus (strain ATCC 28846 / CBS 209.66 / NRRL 28638) TaxID=796925 RepID=A0A137P843_CONC2|nr:hypothetical protein CONCODRAFT_6176 [Conidiobolus coronatus NRRL 28638]|eukprot:KXN71152.1 hypothetical protein CONCODRAFT_6176 [Conidiobolus coronatus NRRL 28638]
MFLLDSQISLVCTSFELAINSKGILPFHQLPPITNPQSQSFPQSYGSILLTSLIYIILSTRGCSP